MNVNLILVLAGVLVIVLLAYCVWESYFNPTRCRCGAASWIEFGIFYDHSDNCPQHPLNRGRRANFGTGKISDRDNAP